MNYQLIKLFEWSKDGNLERIKDYFEKKYKNFGELNYTPKEILVKDNYGRNILHWVCFYGHIQTLRFFAENFLLDLEVTDNEGCTPLDCAAMRGQIIKSFHQIVIKTHSLERDNIQQYNDQLSGELCYPGSIIILTTLYIGHFIMGLCDMDFTLNMKQNKDGYYPIDYLFLTEKPEPYKQETHKIFRLIIQKYKMQMQEKEMFVQEDSDDEPLNSNIKNMQYKFKFYMSELKWGASKEPQIQFPRKTKQIQSAIFEIPNRKFSSSYIKQISEKIRNIDIQNQQLDIDNKMSISLSFNSQRKQKNRLSFFPSQIRVTNRKKQYDMQVVVLNHKQLDSDDFEQRLFYWSAYLNMHEKCMQYIKNGLSPFTRVYMGMSPLHIVAQKGHLSILRVFVETKYTYQGQMLDIRPFLDSLTATQTSTALHLAIERDHYNCAKILLQAGASIQIYNYRNLKPLEIKYNKNITDIKKEYIQRPLTVKEKGFFYVIKTKGQKQFSADIVRNQLINVHQSLSEQGIDFEFLSFQSLEQHKHNRLPLYFYHVIRLGPDAIYKLARIHETRMYNMHKRAACWFHYKHWQTFEFPKGLVLQDLILRALESEFNMDVFMMEGLVLDHFPLEDHITTDEMSTQWGCKDILILLANCMKLESDQVAIRGLCGLSFYYGPVVGWYFAFMVHLISWLLIPSIIGIILGLYMLFYGDFNSQFIPVYAILMALWSTLFVESWKRRENELSFLWDMHDFQKIEQRRAKYSGPFRVDDYGISEFDTFTTFKRRLLAEAPIVLFGLTLALVSWYSFRQIGELVKDNFALSFAVGILTGAVMPILSALYSQVCKNVVNWENHMHESDEQYSYILKVFLFEFVNSYVTLIDKAMSKQDPKQLAISVASIVITRGVIQNQTNIIPYIMNKLKKQEKEKQQTQVQTQRQMSNEEYSFKQPNQANPSQQDNYFFNPLNQKSDTQNQTVCDQEYLFEHKLSVSEQNFVINQVEISANKEPQKILLNEYTDLAIQFGYITMFATAFPGAPIFFMLNLILNLKFSLYNYKNVMRRETAKPAPGLGIWLNIFSLMNYSATVMNCILIGTVNSKQLNNLIGGESSIFRNVMILTFMEHLIILIKFIIAAIIADVPDWVQKELKRQEYVLSYE